MKKEGKQLVSKMGYMKMGSCIVYSEVQKEIGQLVGFHGDCY